MTDLALRFDQPHCFQTLFVASNGAGLGDRAVRTDRSAFAPAARATPVPVRVNRIATMNVLRRPSVEEPAPLAAQVMGTA